MRKLLLSFGLAALLLPVLATAQDTGTAAPLYCPNLSITMQKCAPTRPLSQQRCTDATTEGQVTELQKFLSDYYDLNPADYVSGYFGRLTRDNVRRFQCEKMSICSGDEASTGYGVVGRKTRAAIANACGTETTPPPNNPPPTSPTCTMKATPYTISPGQSSLLSWTSTNANSGTITTLGAVPLYGSQTIFPTQNTTYTGTFWGHQSVATCNASVNVQGQTCQRPNPPAGCHWQSADTCVQDQLICGTTNSCQLDGVEVLNGGIRKFYLYRNQSSSSMCQTYSIDRTCTNGTLSGSTSYQYASCTHTDVETLSCTLDGITKLNGEYHTFYSARTATNCALISLSRACQGTNFTGDSQYQYAGCVNTNTGSPTITITAPTNGQTFTTNSTVPISWTSQNAPAGSFVKVFLAGIQLADNQNQNGTFNWTPTLTGQSYLKVILLNSSGTIYAQSPFVNVLVTAGGTTASVGSCTYKGTTYAEGQQVTVPENPPGSGSSYTVGCDNGAWLIVSGFYATFAGQNVCDTFSLGLTDFECSANYGGLAFRFVATPRHGSAPLSVLLKRNPGYNGGLCGYTINWGDGNTDSETPHLCYNTPENGLQTKTHTYAAIGSYTITYQATGYYLPGGNNTVTRIANIRVDP